MRGGKREGAGRPLIDKNKKKKSVSVFLSPDGILLLDNQQKSRGVLIDEAIREKFKKE